jgi:hypothetical protein
MHIYEYTGIMKDAAVAEFRRCENMKKEILAMTGLWQRYMHLLKVHDEVDQVKRRIGLNYTDGNIDIMSENNLYPMELQERYMEDYTSAIGTFI